MTITDLGTINSSVQVLQLLPNGKVLIHTGSASNFLLEPDATGSYTNGSVRRIADCQYNHLYGGHSISNDGRVYLHAGEYPTSIGGSRVSETVFDPATETFRSYDLDALSCLSQHSGNAIADDGRMYSATRIGTSGVTRPGSYVDSLMAFNLSAGYGLTNAWSESPQIALPNGRSVIITTEAASAIAFAFISPAYSPEMVAAGSGSTSASALSAGPSRSALRDAWQASSAAWRLPNTTDSRGGRYCSTGSGLSTNASDGNRAGVFYEIGAAFYHPGLDRIVLITGLNGIMSFTTAGNSPRIDAVAPLTPTSPSADNQAFHFGTVSPSHVGQSVAAIIASGSFSFVCSTSTIANDVANHLNNLSAAHDAAGSDPAPYRRAVHVRLAGNTRWARIHLTGASVSGSTVTVTGLSTPIFPGDHATIVASGDQVTFARPSYETRDAPAVILPNGHVAYAAGVPYYERNEGFNDFARLLKWDAGSTISFLSADARTVLNGPDYQVRMTLLPTGEVLYTLGNLLRIYTPTQTELTPITGHAPTITSLSVTAVRAGGKLTVNGTQLTGRHEGGFWGDDSSARSNFPIVRLRDVAANRVYYCRTRDYTYRGIGPNRASSCSVILPPNIPPGTYTLELTVNGILATTTPTVTVLTDAGAETIVANRFW